MNAPRPPVSSACSGARRARLRAVWVAAGIAGAAFAAGPGVKVDEGPRRGWELITQYQFNEAEAFFRRRYQEDPSRENRYALGVSLLNKQPKTDGTIAEAAALFAAVIRESPQAVDETGLAARFYAARILQLHRTPADPAAAKAAYAELSRMPGGGFWVDAATVKWATLHLYEVTPWEEKAARLAAAEEALGRVDDPTLRKDLHIILADGFEKFRVSPAAALRHLEAAWDLGIERGIDQGDFLARMGELALRLGDRDRARHYFGEFLKRFRRDERVYWITRKLEDLERGGAS